MLLALDAALVLKGSVRLNLATESLISGRRILLPVLSFLCKIEVLFEAMSQAFEVPESWGPGQGSEECGR